jgi:spore coat protein CotH
MDKRGQGMSISTIILLVLGVIVLVILVIGFSIGWSKIVPYVSSNNVNTVANQCQSACSTQSVYDFCSRSIQLSADGNNYNQTCYSYSTNTSFAKYGIQTCPQLAPQCA